MNFGMGMHIGLSQRIEQSISLPATNWSLVKAFEAQGEQPLRFKKQQLDTSKMDLEKRLQAVDDANKVFRYDYARSQGYDARSRKKVEYFKIPLMRNFNVSTHSIKIKISKKEYDIANAILKGAGNFQRIARAVPYHQLHQDVKEFVKEQGCTLDDVVIVGVDRGGRLPSFIIREALGANTSYTLKVDQANGTNGELDTEKLNELIKSGVLKDKFVLFVDSTVDSGRQIQVLKRYFDDTEWKAKIGHRDWGIVGSNENGRDHYKHRNINWGLNPDESFEDSPLLMGVDYASGTHTQVVDCPSETSERIKSALLEVPKGVILDTSDFIEVNKIKKAYAHFKKAVGSKKWKLFCDSRNPPWDLGVSGIEATTLENDATTPRKKLLIIGNGTNTDISIQDAKYIAQSLAQAYDAIAGTPKGNPGLVLDCFMQEREGSTQLYQPNAQFNRMQNPFGNKTIFQGDTKEDFRENLVQKADAILVLGGNEGTLMETILATHIGKPTYMVAWHGAVGSYATRSLNKAPNIHIVNTLPAAIEGLKQLHE